MSAAKVLEPPRPSMSQNMENGQNREWPKMIWCPAVVLVDLVDRGRLAAKKENAGCFWALRLLLDRPWRSSDSKIGAKPTLLPCPVLLPFTDKSVCVGGTFSLYSVCGGHSGCILCGGDIRDVFTPVPFLWPSHPHSICILLTGHWYQFDNALVLICFQLNLYVFMCQIKTCREIDGCFCDFSVYFCDFVGYFCDLALTSVKRNSVLQLSVSTVSWVTISEEERGIGEERFRISSQGNQYNCKLSAVRHDYKCGCS